VPTRPGLRSYWETAATSGKRGGICPEYCGEHLWRRDLLAQKVMGDAARKINGGGKNAGYCGQGNCKGFNNHKKGR